MSKAKKSTLASIFDGKNITALPDIPSADGTCITDLLQHYAWLLPLNDTSTAVFENAHAKHIHAAPVGELFIDNFVVFACKSERWARLSDKDFIQSVMSSIRTDMSPIQIKKIQRIPKPSRLTTAMKAVIDSHSTTSNPTVFFFKVDPPDDCSVPDLLDGLRRLVVNNHIYIHDIDVTRDYAGTIPCDFERLMNGFIVTGETYQSMYWRGEQFNGYIPVDNMTSVGMNCHTYLHVPQQGVRVRSKAYNKMAQLWQSPGVRVTTPGCHLRDIIDNPSDAFNSTLLDEHTQENGLTRIESTVYLTPDTGIPTYNELTAIHESFADKVRNKCLVKTPIRDQFTELCKYIKGSVYFIDIQQQTLNCIRWVDVCTKKMNGFVLKGRTRTSLSAIYDTIASTCFNGVPVYIFVCDYEYVDDKGVRFERKGFDFNGFRVLDNDPDTFSPPPSTAMAYGIQLGVICMKKTIDSPQQINGSARSIQRPRVHRRLNSPSDVGLIPQPTFTIVSGIGSTSLAKKTSFAIDDTARDVVYKWIESRQQQPKRIRESVSSHQPKKRPHLAPPSDTDPTCDHQPLVTLVLNDAPCYVWISQYEHTTGESLTVAIQGHKHSFHVNTPQLIKLIMDHFAIDTHPLGVLLTGTCEYQSSTARYTGVQFMTREQCTEAREKAWSKAKKKSLVSLVARDSRIHIVITGCHTTTRHDKDVVAVFLQDDIDTAYYVRNDELANRVTSWFADYRTHPLNLVLTGTSRHRDKNHHMVIKEEFEAMG
jgi:hypothetical protein